jgi:hypothetical protein
MDNAVQPL